jgi:hypothetical protein
MNLDKRPDSRNVILPKIMARGWYGSLTSNLPDIRDGSPPHANLYYQRFSSASLLSVTHSLVVYSCQFLFTPVTHLALT